ncbi:OmpW family protein [Mucilaginibacter lutimaris]|uniref:OmpW family protein n=1 Tax=Mucilaginibacter lutimaris TaxID=931629 RepID=A0ABW2ZCW7_9SPHI
MKKYLILTFSLVLFSTINVLAQAKHEWDIRLRAAAVIPQESGTVGVIGGKPTLSNSFIPELDFTYYFANNFSAELILGTTKHKVSTQASDLSAIGASSSADVNLGKVWLLPPTLTFQYHLPVGNFKPYAGAGVNYTIFYNSDAGPVVKGIDYKNKFAFAAQLGFDYDISKTVFINADVKKLLLSTDVVVDASNLTPANNPSLSPVLQHIPAHVKIDPWIIAVGIGKRF